MWQHRFEAIATDAPPSASQTPPTAGDCAVWATLQKRMQGVGAREAQFVESMLRGTRMRDLPAKLSVWEPFLSVDAPTVLKALKKLVEGDSMRRANAERCVKDIVPRVLEQKKGDPPSARKILPRGEFDAILRRCVQPCPPDEINRHALSP